MTKQDVIKKAYQDAGVDWELKKDYIDSNGWVRCSVPVSINSEVETKLMPVEGNERLEYWHHRPKSLSGIENNRAWIKIESEDDLPNETATYWVVYKDGSMICHHFSIRSDFDRILFLEEFTHYQPINKPEKPLF